MKITYTEETINTYPEGLKDWKLYRVELSNGRSGAIWCSPELGRPIDVSIKIKNKTKKDEILPFFSLPEGTLVITDD